MSKVPFKRFITTFLLFGKNVPFITEKISQFGYHAVDQEVEEIFSWLKDSLPEKYKDMVINKVLFDTNDENHKQWLNQLGVFEFYDYILRQNQKVEDPPTYFKWCSDCMWAHGYKDVMSLINILLFNESEFSEISSIVSFKYKKKMSVEAIALYQKIFWDTENSTAKEALYYCKPFRNNALIIRNIRGGTEFEAIENEANGISSIADENSDGSDVPFVFHDVNYIKWKIGYREGISVPTSREFLEKVKEDSVFKYYETMNMTRSVEVEEEDGMNEKIGAYESKKIKHRNVEEQKANMAKKWIDIHIKATNAVPKEGGTNKEDFFDKMRQLDMDFGDNHGEEKIAHIDDMPDILEQVRGDMSEM